MYVTNGKAVSVRLDNIFCDSSTQTPAYYAAVLCALLAVPDIALAVGFDQLQGLNGPQDAAADAIQGRDINGVRPVIGAVPGIGLCQSIATAPNNDSFGRGALELGNRCAELVQTADPSGATGLPAGLNLGIAPEEVPRALQLVVPEETEIMGAGATDTSHDQMTNISSRLQYLRTGTSTLAVSGFHFSGDSLTGGAAGADDYSRWGLFINGSYGTGNKDETFNEDGFDFDAYGVTAGIDYRFNEALVAGVALGFSNADVEIDGNGGDYDSDGITGTLYGMYYTESFYFEGSFAYGSFDYEGQRTINYGTGTRSVVREAESETDGDQYSWSLGAGYTNYAEALNYTVFGRLEGIDADIDAYDETGSGLDVAIANNEWAMHVDDQEIESLQAVIGAQLAYAFSLNFGVFQPFVSAEWHYEFEDDQRTVTANYLNDPFFATGDKSFAVRLQTDDPDEDFFLISAGTTFVLKGGNQLFLNYDTLLGLDDVSSHTITAGVRFEF